MNKKWKIHIELREGKRKGCKPVWANLPSEISRLTNLVTLGCNKRLVPPIAWSYSWWYFDVDTRIAAGNPSDYPSRQAEKATRICRMKQQYDVHSGSTSWCQAPMSLMNEVDIVAFTNSNYWHQLHLMWKYHSTFRNSIVVHSQTKISILMAEFLSQGRLKVNFSLSLTNVYFFFFLPHLWLLLCFPLQ